MHHAPDSEKLPSHERIEVDKKWRLMRLSALAGLLTLLIYFVFRFCCLNYAETTGGRQLALAWFFTAIASCFESVYLIINHV